MTRISSKSTPRFSRAILTAGVLGASAAALLATAGPAAAANGVDGQTMTVCTTNPAGLAFRNVASPDGAVDDHLQNGWHLQVIRHAANGMVYGYSPILNRSDYVDDGHFC